MIDPMTQMIVVMGANVAVLLIWSAYLLIKLALIKILIYMVPQKPRNKGGGMVRATDRFGVDAG